MDVQKEVYKFIADWINIPEAKLSDDMDIIAGVDWAKFEPDEAGEAFFDIFLTKFKVYVPGDYSDFVKKRNIPKLLRPIVAPFYAAFIGDPLRGIDFEKITVGELVEIAETGYWIEADGHVIAK